MRGAFKAPYLLARENEQIVRAATVALSSSGGGELPIAGSWVPGHLLLEDGLNALANSGLYVRLHIMLESLRLKVKLPRYSIYKLPDAIWSSVRTIQNEPGSL